MIKPRPRTPPTKFGNHSERCSRRLKRSVDVPITFDINSCRLSRSSTWYPTEQASGEPPKVVPCVPVSHGSQSRPDSGSENTRTRGHCFSNCISHQYRPEGVSIGQRLGHGHDIRVAVRRPRGMRPQGSCSVQATLDISRQQRSSHDRACLGSEENKRWGRLCFPNSALT
jgi:hypothetical protein